MRYSTLSIVLLAATGFWCPAQEPNPTQQQVQTGPPQQSAAEPTPIFRVNVVSRSTRAINYHHRAGSTEIGFEGTSLMPQSRGRARVKAERGATEIDARFERMQPATTFGPEYLTYVLWAVTPEGRAQNLGQVDLRSGDSARLEVTTELQTFGLIVTAEPYFAVTQPSDVVVLENVATSGTRGTLQWIDAKYELLPRGLYTLNVNKADLTPVKLDSRVPLSLHEARNAVRIARWAGAERYASDTLQKALINLQNAEGFLVGRGGEKRIATSAREAVQMAEDARIITLRRQREEELARIKQDREQAQAAAEAQGRQRAAAEAAAEKARLQADAESRRRAEAEAASEAARQRAMQVQREAEESARRAQQQAEQARLEAQREIERANQAKLDAERARAEAQSEAERSRMLAQQAEEQRLRAEQERAETRQRLMHQLNLVLETRDSARGLIVNMSDVLFDTGKADLKPGARERLAKVAGILLAHPGLNLEIEGHTDSVGGEEFNQRLSERRAASVRDYLVQMGVDMNAITARGFGKNQPVASNTTATGRQLNRRVELVVSGEAIGRRQQPQQQREQILSSQ